MTSGGGISILVASSSFRMSVSSLDSRGESVVQWLGNVPIPGGTSSDLFSGLHNTVGKEGSGLQDSVASWQALTVPAKGELQVAVAQ